MRSMKKIVTSTLLVLTTLTSVNSVEAQYYVADGAGCGYENSCCAPSMAPYIALATVAIVAIIVMAVRHHHHHNSHNHH